MSTGQVTASDVQTTGLWIGGQWVEADRLVSLVNPHTDEIIAKVGYASVAQAEAAIEAAYDAYLSFHHAPAYQRADILYEAARLLQAQSEDAARIIATEAAKPIVAARAEIARTVETYRFAAEAAKGVHGTTVPMDAARRGENRTAYVIRRPIGVVSAITPFNFPFNLVAHKVGPAIAAGNTIVLKPAEQTPLSALFLARLFREAGLPDGVLNIIPGSGQELGEVLSTHPRVQFVTFTGSPRVGRIIRAQAGLRKVTLELGSNSPLLIDAGFSEEELTRIVDETVAGAFSYMGQVCISVQRVYVHRSLFESFAEKLTERAKSLTVGNPMDEDTQVSALINDGARDRLQTWFHHAVSRGARVLCGGTFEGRVMTPTVLTDVPTDVELSCEEAFGPVLVIESVDSWEEAIARANDSKYGLNAGAFTKQVEHAFAAAEKLETGGVLINDIPTFRVDQMPYGGLKESGTGREGVQYALEDMTEVKLVSFRTGVFTD